MDLISTAWSCARCGHGFVSSLPEHGLCIACIADLESLAAQAMSLAATCPDRSDPIGPGCGATLTITPAAFSDVEAGEIDMGGDDDEC
jgi:hypothetical protein